jgi:hypothetical protein
MEQPMHPASPASSLVSNMPQNVLRIVSVLFYAIVGPSYFRQPRRDDIEVCSAWELT